MMDKDKYNFNTGMVMAVVPFAMFIVGAMAFACADFSDTKSAEIADDGKKVEQVDSLEYYRREIARRDSIIHVMGARVR